MIPADPEDLPPQRPSVIARLVSIIEGAVAVVSGAMALFMALIVVVFIFQLAREQKVDSGLALIGLSVAILYLLGAAWCALVSRRCTGAARRIARGEEPPSSFWSLDVTSALSFILVIGAIGALGAIALRQFNTVVEKGRAAEAISFLDGLQSAQASYLKRHGSYADSLVQLGKPPSDLRYFTSSPIATTPAPSPGWTIALQRDEKHSDAFARKRYGGLLDRVRLPKGISLRLHRRGRPKSLPP